jgi:hypothetical protein
MRRRFWTFSFALAASGLIAAAVPACGSTEADPGPGLGDDASIGGDAGDDSAASFDLGTMCPSGSPCGASGICNTAGTCCEPAASVCGAKCCSGGSVCYAGACVMPGKACKSVDDCAEGETCDPSLGGDAGTVATCDGGTTSSGIGRCVPRPPTCPDGVDGGVDEAGVPCTEACEYRPPVGAFDPVTEWTWPFADTPSATYNQVMSAAVVGPLTDDNCDGKYDERDVPAIVFNSYTGAAYQSDGILRAVTGRGKRLWDATDAAARTVPGASVAIGELDASSPGPELATCSTDKKLIVFSAAGKVLWKSDDPKIDCFYGGPQLGDVDGDGTPELLVRYTVVDAKTHKATFQGRTSSYPYPTADYSTFADVDLDGDLDIVGGNIVYRNDGGGLWTTLWDGSKFASPVADGYVAIADLDLAGDGLPEIAVVSSLEQNMHTIRVVRAKDGTTLWGPLDTNLGGEMLSGGGPPTIADFDGDGKPEIAMAGGYSYNVYDGKTGMLKWHTVTQDTSSRATGSSVFDFDGDGKAEVVYADEHNLHVYEGSSGKELVTLCNPSGTLWEYPLVVDADGDDQAEIVLVGNDMWWGCGAGSAPSTGPTGLRLIGSKGGNWVRTRRIWNQHTYHVTNVNDDATIPKKETVNWKTKGLNNFRQNVQPRGLFDAPNAVADVEGTCGSKPTLRARVRNVGLASLPAGVVVGFYSGDPSAKTKLGTATTKGPITPGGFEIVDFEWDSPPSGYFTGSVGIFVIVADDGTPTSVHQCKTSDDTSKVVKNKCTG